MLWVSPEIDPVRKAPVATNGKNIYIVCLMTRHLTKWGSIL
jgi:hypothetical protein